LERVFYANFVQLPKVVTHNFKSAYDAEFSGAMTKRTLSDGVVELQDIRWLMQDATAENWLYATE
jgi:hypothetical protein